MTALRTTLMDLDASGLRVGMDVPAAIQRLGQPSRTHLFFDDAVAKILFTWTNPTDPGENTR